METCKCPRCKKLTCKHYMKLMKNRKFSREISQDSTPVPSADSLTEDASRKKSSGKFRDADIKDQAILTRQQQVGSGYGARGYEEVNAFDAPPTQPPEIEKPPTGDKSPEKGRSRFSLTSEKYELPPMVVMPSPPAKSGVPADPSPKKNSCTPSINITPADSKGNFGIKLPFDSDYDITVKVSLDEKIIGCPETCCDERRPESATKIKMKFETIKDPNKVQLTSDSSTQNTVNKNDSSYCCTESISDQSSYYSANMSYNSVSLSCRSSVNLFESKPPPEIETQRTGAHLAAGCDFCKKEKPIKQLSKAADDASDLTSLYRCQCMSESSESNCVCDPNKTRKTPPSKSKIPIRKNEKCCSCKFDFSKSTVGDKSTDTAAIRSPTQITATSKKEVEEEEPTIVKQVNIDLAEKIKEMGKVTKIAVKKTAEKKIVEKKDSETSVKFENDSTTSCPSDTFDDRQITLPEVRVDVGPEKIKSIHIDVTPVKLDRTSSGIITIPVQLRFKHPPTPPEARSDFSLKYDDRDIKGYFRTQKLLYKNCIDCGENIQEYIEKPPTSDMDIILPSSCSKECQFIREVTVTPPLKKKRKLCKKTQVDDIPWCHKSTYIEPYLKIDKCPTQENVEIQTDLSLGENLMSESLNSSCTSKICKAKKSSKVSRSLSPLQIPWANYTLPCPGDEMLQPVVPPECRREIFPQPEEIIVEITPKKTCFPFPICGKPSPTSCVRPDPANQYKVLVRPQPPTLALGTSSTEPKPGTSGGTQSKPGLAITTHDDIEQDLAYGLRPTTPQLRAKMLLEHPELRKIKSSKDIEDEEDSYENLLSPEPRPRAYRPPRTFKRDLRPVAPVPPQRNSLISARTRQSQSISESVSSYESLSDSETSQRTQLDLKSEKRGSYESKISKVSKKSRKKRGSKQSMKSQYSTRSKKSNLKRKVKDNASNISDTPQQTSKYISTVGKTDSSSSDSCFSDSSYRYRKTPSFSNIREPRSKSLPVTDTGRKEKKKKSEGIFAKCFKRKPKSAPGSTCCPERHVDFCMELPDKVPVPTIKKFVFLDKCPIHEPYLERLHLENIVVPDGTMPWEKLLLPKNINIRKISDIKFEEEKPKSHKMIQINFNKPSRRVSCPTPKSKPSEPENSLKPCTSAPEWLCKCDPKQICAAPEAKGDLDKKSTCFSSRDRSQHLKVNQSNRIIPCSTQQSETVTYYMNENMADTTESNKNLCSCGQVCPLCCKPPRKTGIPCSGYINRKSPAFVLKPDPVMEAFKQCEAELKPVKEALAQVKTDLRSLNMPELDCIFKNDNKEYETPCCKCTKDTGIFKNVYKKKKTEHFYANTTTCTTTAIVEKKHKYWEYEDSSLSTTSSERYRVVPNKRNKGIQKTGSKHRKRCCRPKSNRLRSSSSGSNSPCVCRNRKHTHSTYSSADSSGRSTPRNYKISPNKNKKQQQIMPSNSDCPFLEAMRSALMQSLGQDNSCTRMVKSKKIKKVKMHVKIKPKKH